jgi:hypothetical protein
VVAGHAREQRNGDEGERDDSALHQAHNELAQRD